MPLGLPENPGRSFADALKQAEFTLNPGDMFMLYTDGVTETNDGNGRQFGIERLEQIIMDISVKDNPATVKDATGIMKAALADFAHKKDFSDDITFIFARSVAGSDEISGAGEMAAAALADAN
jgi:sigma-B regulation protein RsbU (phosphoserine phosphatase)